MVTAAESNMYTLTLVVFSILFHCPGFLGQSFPWGSGRVSQRLAEFQASYAKSKADIFFLMDNSASLRYNGRRGFADEKTFITSLLSKIKIAKPATRVAIIRFGTDATIDINYISNLDGLNNKCEFNEAFRSKVYYTGVMTNMNAGFDKCIQILFGQYSKNVRPWKVLDPKGTYVNKVVFLLTDGQYNNGGNPSANIDRLKRNYIEIFAVGVSGVDQAFMRGAATTPDHYFYVNNFQAFRDLATYIRGGLYDKV